MNEHDLENFVSKVLRQSIDRIGTNAKHIMWDYHTENKVT